MSIKQAQEPVAWRYRGNLHEFDPSDWAEGPVTPLYTTQPRREWQKLTDAEIFTSLKATFGDDVKLTSGFRSFARIIEAKLKERNT